MRDLLIDLQFSQCKDLNKDRLRRAAEILFDQKFTLLQKVSGAMRTIQEKTEISDLIEKHLTASSVDKWALRFRAYPSYLDGFTNSNLEIVQLGSGYNRLRIGGLIDFEIVNQREYVEPYAQALRELAVALYPLMHPEIGLIDNGNKVEVSEKSVERKAITSIGWVNFWAPSYVERYGKRFFLEMPGDGKQVLTDGGIYHQLWPTFMAETVKQAKEVHTSVIDYCGEHGVKVKCYAPYIIPTHKLRLVDEERRR